MPDLDISGAGNERAKPGHSAEDRSAALAKLFKESTANYCFDHRALKYKRTRVLMLLRRNSCEAVKRLAQMQQFSPEW